MWRWALILGLSVAACGGDDGPSAGGRCPNGVVTVGWTVNYVAHDGAVTNRPADLRQASIVAVLPDGSEIEAETSLGEFRIDASSDGPVMVRVGSSFYYVLDECEYNFTETEGGAPEGRYPTMPTEVTLAADRAVPWSSGDELVMFDPVTWANHWAWEIHADAGATTVSTEPARYFSYLLDPDDGGAPTIYQRSGAAIVASGPVDPIMMVDGEDTTLHATLTPLTSNRTMTATIDTGAFDTLMGADSGLSLWTGQVTSSAVPSAALGCASGTVDPFDDEFLNSTGTPVPPSFTYDAVPYADPFPTEWDRIACVYFGYLVTGSQDQIADTPWSAFYKQTIDTLDGAHVSPVLGPATGITIDGQDLFAPADPAISSTPTIAWGAPSLGQAFSYEVDVFELSSNGFGPQDVPVAYIVLPAGVTELTLPPGILGPGTQYRFAVAAFGARTTNAIESPVAFSP